MRAVNLLPLDAYAPKQRLPHAPVVLAATVPVLAGALVYLGYSVEHSKVVDRQVSLGVVQSQIASLGPSPALVSESAGVSSARQARETELGDALSKRFPWDVTFNAVSRALPAGTWLTTLTAANPTPSGSTSTAAPATNSFTLQGYAKSNEIVAGVLARLSLVPGLADVTLTNAVTAALTKGSNSIVQFTITATVVPPQ
ncbi:MAG TPA: PilN domain-containing protein [Gaiellaceae bacterium]|nr:PilN domain-containing protein [Gaiellaceae bacterium]